MPLPSLIILLTILAIVFFVFSAYRTSSSEYTHPHPDRKSSEEGGKDKLPFSGLSFHASGWMQIYQGGVAKYIQENYHLDDCKMVGTSGGALVACTLCCDIPMDLACKEILEVRKVNRYNNVFLMCDHTKQIVKKMLPLNCIELIKNRLTIVCSKVENMSLVPAYANSYETYTDVLNYLCATVHIPIFDGVLPQITDNQYLYDGMMTDSHSGILDPCLKVTWDTNCYCGCTKQDDTICPEMKIPYLWCFFPPDERILELLYYHGYYSAQKFFKRQISQEDINLSENIKREITDELHRENGNHSVLQGSAILGGCLGVLHMLI
jgi:hypothetical protein